MSKPNSAAASTPKASADQPAQGGLHQEPSRGGSFVRDMATGELLSNMPQQPTDQPSQE